MNLKGQWTALPKLPVAYPLHREHVKDRQPLQDHQTGHCAGDCRESKQGPAVGPISWMGKPRPSPPTCSGPTPRKCGFPPLGGFVMWGT